MSQLHVDVALFQRLIYTLIDITVLISNIFIKWSLYLIQRILYVYLFDGMAVPFKLDITIKCNVISSVVDAIKRFY